MHIDAYLGVVTEQPGKVMRDTRYGTKEVCNAVVRAGKSSIRCAFWGQQAEALAAWPVSSAIALYQVNVAKASVKNTMSWEIRATEATVVEACPVSLAAGLLRGIEDQGDAPVQALSVETVGKDYDTAAATTSSLGALQSVIVPGVRRELDGTYEVHSVGVIGCNAVLRNESYVMKCCSRCKKQLSEEGSEECAEHPDASTELRWLFQLELADTTGHCGAMLYHDVAMKIPEFQIPVEVPVPAKVMQKVVKSLRETPWSVRVVYQTNAVRETNYLEIKLMLATLTLEGVVGSWCLTALPTTMSSTACPFAKCAAVTYDSDLGLLEIDGATVSAVRLLLAVLRSEDDEETAIPDTSQGLRVTRRVVCALEDSGSGEQVEYKLAASGSSGSVQWLVRAEGTFFVTATKKDTDDIFVAQTYMEVTPSASYWKAYMCSVLAVPKGISLTFDSTITPMKRKREIDEGAPCYAAGEVTMSKRRREYLDQNGERVEVAADKEAGGYRS